MRYLLLLANDPDAWDDTDARADDQLDDGVFGDWLAYTRALSQAGVLVEGHALQSPAAATTVQVRHGRRLVVDGPFADTKEHLIGYYVIDVVDLDAALDWAARVPNARAGSIEVRPVVPASDPGTVLSAGRAPDSHSVRP